MFPHEAHHNNRAPPCSLHHTTPPPISNNALEGPSRLEEGNNQPATEDGWEDKESEDEEDDLDNTSESSHQGWEPPVSNDTNNMSVSSDNADSESGLPPSYIPPKDLHEWTWVTPKVVKFPNPRASKAICSVDSTNNPYATLLRNDSNSNPFRLFASKIDREVEKWAKLQGPSSTLLMNLLKIEGVMPFRPNS